MSSDEPLTSEYLFRDDLAKQLRGRRNLAKLANLGVTLHIDAPVQGTKVPATRSVLIKGLKKICYG